MATPQATQKTETERADEAYRLAVGNQYIAYNTNLYAPVDYETGVGDPIPPDERKCWVPMSNTDIRRKAKAEYFTLFKDEKQLINFVYMMEQHAEQAVDPKPWLMIKTKEGLMVLQEDGKLHPPDGSFVPNTLQPMLNEDPDDKAFVLDTITDWLGGKETQVQSLLSHLATTLAPHWSAGKYVLLIGDGRNGKSVLMTMLERLVGESNCSHVERQDISAGDKGSFDLNGKLINLVMDGPATFVKDSGKEKSLITGETIKIRRLYSNVMTAIQTNALFIEGLNQEPRSTDKSAALQARLVRFHFPNKYDEDRMFFRKMTDDRMVGALLSLLIDNYVQLEDVGLMLAPTEESRRQQQAYMLANSMPLQWIIHLEETGGAELTVIGEDWEPLFQQYKSWQIEHGEVGPWDQEKVLAQFNYVWKTDRRSKRIEGVPRQIRYVTEFKQDTLDLIATIKEGQDVSTPVVEN